MESRIATVKRAPWNKCRLNGPNFIGIDLPNVLDPYWFQPVRIQTSIFWVNVAPNQRNDVPIVSLRNFIIKLMLCLHGQREADPQHWFKIVVLFGFLHFSRVESKGRNFPLVLLCKLQINSRKPELESNWPCGPMDKALDYESRDCRFESCQGRFYFLQKRKFLA